MAEGIILSNVVTIKENKKTNYHNRILSQKDLYEILPFGRTKIQQMFTAGVLPCTRVGKDYITTFELIEKWIRDNIGSEVYF